MTTDYREARVDVTREDLLDAIDAALGDGRRDQLEGGVHPTVMAEYLDDWEPLQLSQTPEGGVLFDLLNDMADEGVLERVRGVEPGSTRPRTSFLPAGYEEGDDRA